MTYRDPLYDPDPLRNASPLDDEIEITVDEELIVGDLTPGGSDTLSSVGNQERGGDLKQQGEQAMSQAKEKGTKAMDEAQKKGEQAMNEAQKKGDQVMHQAEEMGQQAMDKVSELGGQAQQKADQGFDKASSGLSSAADMLREQGEQQDGQLGNVAATAADKLDSASGYLQEHDSSDMVADLEDLVRRKPVESLLVAAGVGLLLSRIFR